MKRVLMVCSLTALILAGCNFSGGEDENPTAPAVVNLTPTQTDPAIPITETAVAVAALITETPSPTATPLPTETGVPTETEVPTETQAPTITPVPTEVPPTETLTPTISMTPPPTFTPLTSMNAAGDGATSTVTPLFFESETPSVGGPPAAVMPTNTPTLAPAEGGASPTTPPTFTPLATIASGPTQETMILPTDAPSFTPTQHVIAPSAIAPPPTFTPAPTQVAQLPSSTNPDARVCTWQECEFLRLRETPGTAGDLVMEMDPGTPLTLTGRTEDTKWVSVILDTGTQGWCAVSYLEVFIDLNALPITGEATNVEPQPISPGGDTGAVVGLISGVSATSRSIFLNGLARGNNPYVFSKVGDSITVSPWYLRSFGLGSYNLGDHQYLQSVLNFFSGPNGRGENPFSANSIAAGNGWSTESVLNSANAGGSCQAGETPLACEYRVNKPAVALIMFGTNDSGGMPTATYQNNLKRIVEISIDMGVIPVLSTIPPKHYDAATDSRVYEFNQVIIATARAYDIPLWDYYSQMTGLPGEGLSPDGVHPNGPPGALSTDFSGNNLNYGYPQRNLGALQVLWTLWQQILYDAGTVQPPSNPQPVVQPTAETSQPATDPVTNPGTGSYSCPGAPAPRLTVGGQGRVTPGMANKMRSSASTSGGQVGSIPGEAVFSVVGGPTCADGYTWWQVTYEGVTGWTASGTPSEYWVEPVG